MKRLLTILILFVSLNLSSLAGSPADPMILVEGGRFMMGDPACTDGSAKNVAGLMMADGLPRDGEVQSFLISPTEVTVGEFRRFVRASGYRPVSEKSGSFDVFVSNWFMMKKVNWRSPGFPQTDRDPVVCVDLIDAVEYCNWRSVRDGLAPCYRKNGDFFKFDPSAGGYRLPSETEWEYAARERGKALLSGDISALVTGGRPTANVADETFGRSYPELKDIWTGYTDGYVFTAPVGRLAPNALGINDMLGNAAEWTWTNFEDPKHPLDLQRAGFSVGKGGSWFRPIALGRRSLSPSTRLCFHPFAVYNDLGFRLVRNAP